jgi:hypothetical protein
VAGILNSCGNLPLVFGASAGLTTGANFSGFVDETGQQFDIFVIDRQVFVSAELTKLGAGNKTSVATATLEISMVTAV